MKLRRPKKGYLIFPEISRPDEGGAENKVRNLLNFLLRKAVEKCLPDFDLGNKPWTTIRHTAFRLTLEEMPELGIPPAIDTFASNGHTSADMLREKYLYHIEREKTATEARKKIKPSSFSLIKRVSLDD